MKDYTLAYYDDYRNLIFRFRENDYDWADIEYARKGNDSRLEAYLLALSEDQLLPKISVDDWKELVKRERHAEEHRLNAQYVEGHAMMVDGTEDGKVVVPKGVDSAWQLYKKHLIDSGFKRPTVDEIERSTLRILRRLSTDTTDKEPVKGLVIGNVQSGKTANMAALMAMAADWGWNMFIILSGTIENLRLQTQSRLLNDLNKPGRFTWQGLDRLSKQCDQNQKTQYLNFNEGAHIKYFTVCLKNSTRLANLIQWLQDDPNKQRQMKILLIDDEADQAGVNTKKIRDDSEEQERNRINNLIVNLVSGLDERGKPINSHYKAMNYIGYTATPYANVLNEARLESLYPRNFISTLSVSKEYFGPQQIFGADGMDYDGMDIIREIDSNEMDIFRNIHNGEIDEIPKSFEDAFCWFLCGASTMRLWNYSKPISMLIHTSQKQSHHRYIATALKTWADGLQKSVIVEKCREIWEYETQRFTFDDFRAQYPDYDRLDDEINKYPTFSEIEDGIYQILKDISYITLGNEGELEYHKGIHICIDNCSNNGINEDGVYMRLAYPASAKMPSPAPIFVVVGGATLSRGLTIEGLISTVFLRSVAQADTLMQMGRWFGYRKGYELLPRIWLTQKTRKQFEFLSLLDQELRDEIYRMDRWGISPSEYGPKIKNTPLYKFIRITAANRMQGAQLTDMDYSGYNHQTIIFDDDKEVMKNNISVTDTLLTDISNPTYYTGNIAHAPNCMVWKSVPFIKIKSYLKSFAFSKNMRIFNDIDGFVEWMEKMTADELLENWSVILAGTATGKEWETPYGKMRMVNRTRRGGKIEAGIINIGVLRNPSDMLADVECVYLPESDVDKIKRNEIPLIREKAGLSKVPQLIIYRIDKDSKIKNTNCNRFDLNSKEDVIGMCINIPGDPLGRGYATAVQIRLNNNEVMEDDMDL